jgi:hypothetical protein
MPYLIVHGAHLRMIDVSANVEPMTSILWNPVAPRRTSSTTHASTRKNPGKRPKALSGKC